MMTCAVIAPGAVLCGPSDKERVPQNRYRVKWCFSCRRRVRHRLILVDQLWYDVEGYWRCGRCHKSRTGFPS